MFTENDFYISTYAVINSKSIIVLLIINYLKEIFNLYLFNANYVIVNDKIKLSIFVKFIHLQLYNLFDR